MRENSNLNKKSGGRGLLNSVFDEVSMKAIKQ